MSGDSTVAYAWAYCMALESACAVATPERAEWLRALLLERERVANHLGDLGALGNDAALAFGLAQFSRLREDWQRLSKDAFGHRLLMDWSCRAASRSISSLAQRDAMRHQCDRSSARFAALRQIYDEHAGLQDRFMTTGRVAPELAARLGLTGLAGRASGQAYDLRCDHAWQPYRPLEVRMVTTGRGDVAARVAVRFDEVFESLRLIRELCSRPADGAVTRPLDLPDSRCRSASAGSKAGAARCWWRWSSAPRPHPALPLPRSVVAELAGARACRDRQHRSGLPADQQVVQPELFGHDL